MQNSTQSFKGNYRSWFMKTHYMSPPAPLHIIWGLPLSEAIQEENGVAIVSTAVPLASMIIRNKHEFMETKISTRKMNVMKTSTRSEFLHMCYNSTMKSRSVRKCWVSPSVTLINLYSACKDTFSYYYYYIWWATASNVMFLYLHSTVITKHLFIPNASHRILL